MNESFTGDTCTIGIHILPLYHKNRHYYAKKEEDNVGQLKHDHQNQNTVDRLQWLNHSQINTDLPQTQKYCIE